MREQSLFIEALEEEDPARRAALLDRACAGDAALRGRIERLLQRHEQAGSFLEPPALAATTDEPARERPGAVVGPYKLLEQIGEGGFGVVYMAEQTQPVRRKVALKVLKPGMDTRQVVARFEAERQALALMDHPNIAHVFDGGETASGRPYFVMELVRGVPITDFCDQNHLPIRERLRLFVSVCQAVQHAHHKGVIHRDLKPSNVLVTLHDGTPVAKVIDFGVAKSTGQQLTDKTLFTGFAQLVGTPLYMSPEQAQMSGLDVDTRSDVYSLGVLLYELLTGTTPFDQARLKGAGFDEVRRIIREEEPPKPSTRFSTLGQASATVSANRQSDPKRLSQLFRGELDWVVMKCLEKDRNRRYETANSLALDLQRYLAGEPVQAVPPSVSYRLRKIARQYRAALTTAATVAALLLAGIVMSSWQAVRATHAEREAVTNEQKALASEATALQKRQEAIDAREELRETLYAAEMNLIQAAWETDNLPRARELLRGQIPPAGKRDLRGFEWHYWDRLCHAEASSLRLAATFPDRFSDALTFSRDGTRLATLIPSKGTLALRVWDTTTGRERLSLPLPGGEERRYVQALSADGGRVGTIGWPASAAKAASLELRVWSAVNGKELAAIPVPGVGPEQYVRMALSADGTRVLTVVRSVDRRGPNPYAPKNAARLNVWEVATGKALLTVALGSVYQGLSLSPDGTRAAAIVSLGGEGDYKAPHGVQVWDVKTGKKHLLLKGSGGEPFEQVVFSPDGRQIAATGVSMGGTGLWVWDAATGKELRALGGRRVASLVQFSPDGKHLANYSRHSPTVTLWETATGQAHSAFKGHTSGVLGVAFSADGRRLRTLAQDGTVRTWDVRAAERPGPGGVASIRFAHVAISPDGTRIAEAQKLGPEADRIGVFDTSGKRVRSIPLPKGVLSLNVDEIVLNRAGTRLAASWFTLGPGGVVSHVKVWDTASGQELLARTVSGRRVLAISPDGERLAVPFAVGDPDARGWRRIGGVKVVGVADGKEVQALRLRPHPDLCFAAFSPDGQRLATAPQFFRDDDGNDPRAEAVVRVWDLGTGKEVVSWKGKGAAAFFGALTFSPDGSLLAVGYQPEGGTGAGVIDVREAATGRRRHTLRGHASRVMGIAFSPDGRRIVSGGIDPAGGDSDVRVWDAATGKELTTWSCPGAILGLAFRPDGQQLIGVRGALADSESATVIWDGTPRPQRRAPPAEKR